MPKGPNRARDGTVKIENYLASSEVLAGNRQPTNNAPDKQKILSEPLRASRTTLDTPTSTTPRPFAPTLIHLHPSFCCSGAAANRKMVRLSFVALAGLGR